VSLGASTLLRQSILRTSPRSKRSARARVLRVLAFIANPWEWRLHAIAIGSGTLKNKFVTTLGADPERRRGKHGAPTRAGA